MNHIAKKTCAGIAAAGLALMAFGPVAPAPAYAGTVTVIPASGNEGVVYKAVKVFQADVDGVAAQHIAWADDAGTMQGLVEGVIRAEDSSYSGTSAQEALEFIKDHWGTSSDTRKVANADFANKLADALDGQSGTDIEAGTTGASLGSGWYLITTKDSSLASQAKTGTSPIFTAVGAEDVRIYEKTDVPIVTKQVDETTNRGFGSNADANTGRPVACQITGTLPSNFVSYDGYHYEFNDEIDQDLSIVREADDGSVVAATQQESATKEISDALLPFVHVFIINDGVKTEVDLAGSVAAVPADQLSGITEGDDDAFPGYKLEYNNDQLKVILKGIDNIPWQDADGNSITLNADSSIEVQYLVTLEEGATTGGTGNTTSTKLIYSNNPNTDTTGQSQPATARIHTYKVDFTKLDAVTSEQLKDGKFTIRVALPFEADGWASDDSAAQLAAYLNGKNATFPDPDNLPSFTGITYNYTGDPDREISNFASSAGTDGVTVADVYTSCKALMAYLDDQTLDIDQFFHDGAPVKYVQADGSYATTPHQFTTGDDGKFEVSGLDAGTYILTEAVAPGEYDTWANPLTLEITRTFDENNQAVLTATASGGEGATIVDVATPGGDGHVSVSGTDSKIINMPLTGQAGLATSVVLGVLLVGGGIFFMVRRNRQNQEEE